MKKQERKRQTSDAIRDSVLSAGERLADEGKAITRDSLREAGARGNEKEMMGIALGLVRAGLIPLEAWNRGRGERTRIEPDAPRPGGMAAVVAIYRQDYWRAWKRIRRGSLTVDR